MAGRGCGGNGPTDRPTVGESRLHTSPGSLARGRGGVRPFRTVVRCPKEPPVGLSLLCWALFRRSEAANRTGLARGAGRMDRDVVQVGKGRCCIGGCCLCRRAAGVRGRVGSHRPPCHRRDCAGRLGCRGGPTGSHRSGGDRPIVRRSVRRRRGGPVSRPVGRSGCGRPGTPGRRRTSAGISRAADRCHWIGVVCWASEEAPCPLAGIEAFRPPTCWGPRRSQLCVSTCASA